MQKKKHFFATILLLLSITSYSQVVVVGHIFAEVVENLSVMEEAQLNFGKFSVMDGGGTITISPDGGRSSSGSVKASAGNNNAATFMVTGQKNAHCSIYLPTDETIISDGKHGRMKVTAWKLKEENRKIKLSGGIQNISVGATLVIDNPENTPKGLYSGTYTIRFDYN